MGNFPKILGVECGKTSTIVDSRGGEGGIGEGGVIVSHNFSSKLCDFLRVCQNVELR